MTAEIFTVHEGHLISLAASVAAGCLPCAGYYIERATEAGVCREDLRHAIDVAASVRRCAADEMVGRVRARLGEPVESPDAVCVPEDEMAVLLSLAAAYAVNSQALVTRLFDAAHARQLPTDRILEAVQIARGVRSMAVAILDRCIEREGGPGGEGQDVPASCICR
jgi:AhpD family alkylhydroperoxidase